MNEDIGKKVKELRTRKKITLKDLSSKTNLSTGFLSQMERGLTAIATDSLLKIAYALGVNLNYFFSDTKMSKKCIIRSYEKEIFQIQNSGFVIYSLTNDIDNKNMLPRFIVLLPLNNDEPVDSYPHEGEEFIYVLEGTLTLFINNERNELFPGDSAHYNSEIPHNWTNYTNKLVKFIQVNFPAKFEK